MCQNTSYERTKECGRLLHLTAAKKRVFAHSDDKKLETKCNHRVFPFLINYDNNEMRIVSLFHTKLFQRSAFRF